LSHPQASPPSLHSQPEKFRGERTPHTCGQPVGGPQPGLASGGSPSSGLRTNSPSLKSCLHSEGAVEYSCRNGPGSEVRNAPKCRFKSFEPEFANYMASFEPEDLRADEGLSNSGPISENGLSRKGYHYAHNQSYYKDGRICDPPKSISIGELGDEPQCSQTSQSKWNFKVCDVRVHVNGCILAESLFDQSLVVGCS
jgi:hypothetical protein